MKKYFTIIFSFLLTSVQNKKESSPKNKQWTHIDLVQLIKNSKNKKYSLFDPDDFIKLDEEIILHKELKNIYNTYKVNTYIIFIKSISPKLFDKNDKNVNITKFTEDFVNEIFKQKIIPKNNSIISVVISAEPFRGKMSLYGNVSEIIKDEDCLII